MANGSGFFVHDGIGPVLDKLSMGVSDRAAEAFLEMAPRVLDDAKANAPWSDRTGDARAGLDVDVDEEGHTVVLTLFHTVDYGLWLEVIQNGRFAIIMPTLEAWAGRIFEAAGGRVFGEE